MDVVVENLTKSFENQKAVDSISFKAKRGEILGFLGPNGAGKTTTMKIMAGLLTPDFGNITFGDYSIWKQAGKIKNIIGYLPERNPLYDEMNNGFGWKRLPKSFLAENTVYLLKIGRAHV